VKYSLLLCGLLHWAGTVADTEYVPDAKIPQELKPFVEVGTRVLACEAADLNGDGRQDYVLVLEKQAENPDAPVEVDQRPLIILLRDTEQALKPVKRNAKIVACSTCGGVWGDPFAGIEVGTKTFTVSHYGGSNWRWANSYKFNYSRIDKSWQLVRVEEMSFHTSDPDRAKTKTYLPSKHYGKIDIAEFDPENYLNELGKREAAQ
jgi:hypothetical protein